MKRIKYSNKDKQKGLKIPEKVSADLAYLSGIFAGDGSISIRKNKNEYSLKCVGNPKDEQLFYLEIISKKFKRIFGFAPRCRYLDSETTFGFVIFSKVLINYLTTFVGLPIGRKYDQLKIPEKFLIDDELLISFIRGVFDTDGCITFKKRYKDFPYYPVISFSSKSKRFVKEIANILKAFDFNIVEIYDYKVKDFRVRKGFTVINRLELNGKANLRNWMERIGFWNPKNVEKVKKYWKG